MKVKINNEELDFISSTSVSDYIQSLSLPSSGLAIAINNVLVPRNQWETTQFQENDQVIIIQAAYGG